MENNENKHIPEQNESNSAKRLRMLGDTTTEDIHLKSDEGVKGDFWANLWYQRKWAIIIGGITLLLLIALTFTLCHDKKNDMNIIYVGPNYDLSYNDKLMAMNEKFALICPDYDENGEVSVSSPVLIYKSPEQLEAYKKANPNRDLSAMDKANNDAYNQFAGQIMSGELSIYLIDPYLYKQMARTACVPISEVLGYECDESLKYDEKAIYFCKTDFATYFDEFDGVPEDTLMCVVKTVNTDDDFFADSCDYFKRIVEFKAQ